MKVCGVNGSIGHPKPESPLSEANLRQVTRGMICLNFTKGGLRRGASQN